MKDVEPELPFYEEPHYKLGRSGAEEDNESSMRALDELFNNTRQYRSGADYLDVIKFVSRFPFYSPFNAMLTHVQMPDAICVASASRWLQQYGRRIKPGAHPLVILQPGGPVMFVFDVSETDPLEGALELPDWVTHPFEVSSGNVGYQYEFICSNARRDGIEVVERAAGSQSAGEIRGAAPGRFVTFAWTFRRAQKRARIPVSYELLLNSSHSPEARYATLVHELAHLYCGHLGTPNSRWWPDRCGLLLEEREFEAESVCYLVCSRAGIRSPSEQYLSNYLGSNGETPLISLDIVLKVAGIIEQMGHVALKPRKERE